MNRLALLFLYSSISLAAWPLGPSVSGDGTVVLTVPQHTFEIATLAETPVLETCSLGPCVALAIVDSAHARAALAHFDAVTQVADSFASIKKVLGEGQYSVYLAGGMTGWSEEMSALLESEIQRAGWRLERREGPFPFGDKFRCARVELKSGLFTVSIDPGVAHMPTARYDSSSPLQRVRETVLFPYVAPSSTPVTSPMPPPPIPPSAGD